MQWSVPHVCSLLKAFSKSLAIQTHTNKHIYTYICFPLCDTLRIWAISCEIWIARLNISIVTHIYRPCTAVIKKMEFISSNRWVTKWFFLHMHSHCPQLDNHGSTFFSHCCHGNGCICISLHSGTSFCFSDDHRSVHWLRKPSSCFSLEGFFF